ncbi:GT2 family glycosyltransferase [Leucobacter exalbidus]|uniref:GT2 family glycosyltransferase n=1 Tax=Leucobacter exalbidus TaxID=662960 RepID=A0A940T3W5_9MICO|nr:glycosyltransferase family A protein [Leucobacter exalbidus]MBP1326219.1 GT2 family glycosyltransferase [Leucobacter exalbidus]
MNAELRPTVSVVIPCYNAAATLGLQLEALAAQINPPEFEIIVVDNRSTDDTALVARRWVEALPVLRVVNASELAGASYARNVGAAASNGQFLMFCDADDVVGRHWVQHGHRDFSTADCWTGSAVPISTSEFVCGLPTLWERIGDVEEPENFDFEGNDHDLPILCGGCFGITRELYLEIGGFDQSFGSAGEDNELAWRLRRAGYPLPISRSTKIAYRIDDRLPVLLSKTRAAAIGMVRLSRRYDAKTQYTRLPWIVRNAVGATVAFARGSLRGAAGAALRAAARQRWAASAGAASGLWQFRRSTPAPQLGLGFAEGREQQKAAT